MSGAGNPNGQPNRWWWAATVGGSGGWADPPVPLPLGGWTLGAHSSAHLPPGPQPREPAAIAEAPWCGPPRPAVP